MAATNYYLGLKRGQNLMDVVAATSTGGTATDIELRIQINDGTNATGITKKDVFLLLEILEQYVNSNAFTGGSPGTDLPAL